MYSSRMRTARSSSRLLEGVSASVHAGIPPRPRVWAWTAPGQTPNLPLGLGLDPPGQTPQPSSWAWAYTPPQPDPQPPPGPGPRHPPVNRMTDRQV